MNYDERMDFNRNTGRMEDRHVQHDDNHHVCNENCFEQAACERHVDKEFKVSVPVSITPVARPHEPEVKCMGDVKVHPGIKRCEKSKESFHFTVAQNISVKIPIHYRTKTCYGRECAENVEEARMP